VYNKKKLKVIGQAVRVEFDLDWNGTFIRQIKLSVFLFVDEIVYLLTYNYK
jgi:hypothetical protein